METFAFEVFSATTGRSQSRTNKSFSSFNLKLENACENLFYVTWTHFQRSQVILAKQKINYDPL